jgi:peptidoglycan LD-endopeptidase CwlK
MPSYGAASKAHLEDHVHSDLVRLHNAVIKHRDCRIIDGVRTRTEQIKNIEKGVSKTMNSKHLPQEDGLSHATDSIPWPIENGDMALFWTRVEKGLNALKKADPTMQAARFYHYQGFVAGMAAAMGIELRQGCDWDGDGEVGDHSFIDLPHNELRTDAENALVGK